MALPYAQPLDVIDIRPLGAALREAVTTSLLKTDKLQLMRVVLPAGHSLPEHRAPGELTVQCLEGQAELTTPGRCSVLAAGQLMALPAGEAHAVLGLTDTSLLVSLLLHA